MINFCEWFPQMQILTTLNTSDTRVNSKFRNWRHAGNCFYLAEVVGVFVAYRSTKFYTHSSNFSLLISFEA